MITLKLQNNKSLLVIYWLNTKFIFICNLFMSSLNSHQRENLVESIANNFRNKFINKSGLISRNYPPDERSIIDNFDILADF